MRIETLGQLVAHLELHGVGAYSYDEGITFVLTATPPTENAPTLASSVFDNGPWHEAEVRNPDIFRPVAWSDISADMLCQIRPSQIATLIATR